MLPPERKHSPRKKILGKWPTMIAVFLLAAFAIVGSSLWIAFTIRAKANDYSKTDNTSASTEDLKNIFEAYGLRKESMPEIIPVMQAVEGKAFEVYVQNMLYKKMVQDI